MGKVIQKNMFNDVSFFGMVNFLIPIHIKFQVYILKYSQFVKVICSHLETRNRMYNFQTTRGREMIKEEKTNLMPGDKEKEIITHTYNRAKTHANMSTIIIKKDWVKLLH